MHAAVKAHGSTGTQPNVSRKMAAIPRALPGTAVAGGNDESVR